MKTYILLIAIAGIVGIGVAMTLMSFHESALVSETTTNPCVPNMELMTDGERHLCVTGRGKVYVLATSSTP